MKPPAPAIPSPGPSRTAGASTPRRVTGYASREIVATPETRQRIEIGQAFAWNPSLPGAKAEGTFVLSVNGAETITSV